MKKIVFAAMGAVLVLTACDSLRDAMSPHVDVVAEAADQPQDQPPANLLGTSKAPLRKMWRMRSWTPGSITTFW